MNVILGCLCSLPLRKRDGIFKLESLQPLSRSSVYLAKFVAWGIKTGFHVCGVGFQFSLSRSWPSIIAWAPKESFTANLRNRNVRLGDFMMRFRRFPLTPRNFSEPHLWRTDRFSEGVKVEMAGRFTRRVRERKSLCRIERWVSGLINLATDWRFWHFRFRSSFRKLGGGKQWPSCFCGGAFFHDILIWLLQCVHLKVSEPYFREYRFVKTLI